jgi:cell division septal protein FtsQ
VWWHDDKPITVRRRHANRRRPTREPILMVNARVAEKRQEWRHRISTIVLVTVTVLALAWGAMVGTQHLVRVLFTENDQFVITKLDCASDPGGRLKSTHITEYASLKKGMNLFGVDLDEVREDLESVPLVSSVEVRRQLPDTLVVRVTERMALARLGSRRSKLPLAVDREGYVLGPSSVSPSLPAITGFGKGAMRPGNHIRASEIRDAIQVLDICDSTRLNQYIAISTIDVGHPEFMDLRLSNAERVLLAREDLDWRLRQVAAILQTSQQGGRSVAMIDATGEDIFPVKYR